MAGLISGRFSIRARQAFATIALVACSRFIAAHPADGRAAAVNMTRGCIERFDASVDYFPDKAAIEDASNFIVEYRKSYKVVTLKEAYAGGPPERYVLVQCGAPAPTLRGPLAGAQLVTVPIRSMFAFSPTHIPLLVDLGRVAVLAGVTGVAVDVERVVTSKPGLFMSGGVSNPAFAVVRSAGIPVVANTEWLERTALGRAEWLKYMALFLNEERRAQSLALVAQIVSILPGSAGVLPLNAVTSLLGAPVVVTVLLRSQRGAFAG